MNGPNTTEITTMYYYYLVVGVKNKWNITYVRPETYTHTHVDTHIGTHIHTHTHTSMKPCAHTRLDSHKCIYTEHHVHILNNVNHSQFIFYIW